MLLSDSVMVLVLFLKRKASCSGFKKIISQNITAKPKRVREHHNEGLGVEDRGVEGSMGKGVEWSRICHPDPDTPTP